MEVVTGGMLRHASQMEGRTGSSAISLSKPADDRNCIVGVKHDKQFMLVTRFVGRGIFFKITTDALQDSNDVCEIPHLGACNDYLAPCCTRVADGNSLEQIFQI